MDAMSAFTHLADNVPSWIDRISDLIAHTTKKHAEYKAAVEEMTMTRRGNKRRQQYSHSNNRLQRRKNSSIRSIHTGNQQEYNDCESFNCNDIVIPNGEPYVKGDNHYENPRKRGADQISFDDEYQQEDEEEEEYTTRPNIEYDGYIQTALGQIATEMNSARNNLRIAKVSERRPQLPSSPSSISTSAKSSRNYENDTSELAVGDSGQEEEDHVESAYALLASIRTARSRGPEKIMSLDITARQLEVINDMFEVAACEALRVGHCEDELQLAKEKLLGLLGKCRKFLQGAKSGERVRRVATAV